MNFYPTQSGGRILKGDTDYGVFNFEFDADENMIVDDMTFRTPSIGLGDTVEALTGKAKIKKCPKCNDRQTILNRWFPYTRIIRIWNCIKG